MQKIINVLALLSFGVSTAVVAGGVYVYTQKDALVEAAKTELTDAITELLGTSQIGSVLVEGIGEDVDVTDEALGVDENVPVQMPSIPF